MSELLITVQQSAEVLRMWIEPIEQILIDHGWTRITDMPNVWINQKGETSFLAEALRGLIAAATAQHEAHPVGYVCGQHMQPAAVCPACELAKAQQRIRELEAERDAAKEEVTNLRGALHDHQQMAEEAAKREALLVAEVRRCWAAAKRGSDYYSDNCGYCGGIDLDRPAEVRTIVEDDIDICPECGREKAKSIDDACAGMCPKWYATRDESAAYDCARHSAKKEATQ